MWTPLSPCWLAVYVLSGMDTCNAQQLVLVGPDLLLNSGTVGQQYPSVASLSATTSVMCYSDEDNSRFGTCHLVSIVSTSLSIGPGIVFNSAITWAIEVASLGASSAVVRDMTALSRLLRARSPPALLRAPSPPMLVGLLPGPWQ